MRRQTIAFSSSSYSVESIAIRSYAGYRHNPVDRVNCFDRAPPNLTHLPPWHVMKLLSTLTAALIWSVTACLAAACPFCTAVSQTLRQEMAVMDAVVVATAVAGDADRDLDAGTVQMKVDAVLKGEALIRAGETVLAVYYGSVEAGRQFMLSGVDPADMQWSCLPLSDTAVNYVKTVAGLPVDDAAARLRFYYDYLESPESMLARDAYDEFAITPYEDVRAIAETIDREQLHRWIDDPQITADRRRLYLTLLGVVGGPDDLPKLKALLTSTSDASRSGLDALIGCYLTLAGTGGLPLIDELFLSNQQASYADTYAAIAAVRNLGTLDLLPRSELAAALHPVLHREALADLVIPDLARWQDWSQVETIKQLFLDADADNNWVRVPAVNYLRACPLPQAEAAIEELTKVDPESVRRANTFFSIPKPAPEPASAS